MYYLNNLQGDWLHIFPEGRTLQECGGPRRDELGRWTTPSGRFSPPGRHLGPLKWGVGKAVAKSPVPPIVVPIFHKGMESVLPHGKDNQLKNPLPKPFQDITVKVGDPIYYKDITDQYNIDIEKCQTREERRVRRRKYYADLTDRIDESLAKLEKDLYKTQQIYLLLYLFFT